MTTPGRIGASIPISPRTSASTLARASIAWLALVGFVGFTACGSEIAVPLLAVPAKPPTTAHLKLNGSSTMAPLMVDIAARFQADHPNVAIDVRSSASGKGVSEALAGVVDIGMVSRVLKGDEQQLKCFAVARDGLCFIVHSSNAVLTLSAAQAADIYTSRITDWSEVGGAAGPIYTIDRADGRGSVDVISKAIGLNTEDMRSQSKTGDNAETIRRVATNSAAIGYVSIAAAEHAVLDGVTIKLLAFGGVEASTASLNSGDFPIARPLILVTREAPQGMQREFIDYCLSTKVVDLIRQHSFAPYQD
jgi:phosphate transport system substrate-binding protein